MTRLHTEWQRLYLPLPAAGQRAAEDDEHASLIDPQGQVRAMVLEVAGPADWASTAGLWQGAQADLDLPAPAIAVSGTDGYQLWFSLAQAVPVAQAAAFLAGLRARYLPELAPERLGLMPGADQAIAAASAWTPRRVPALYADTGNWSAFVAPDLAPVFAESPWLDIPPSLEGQAELLSRLDSILPAAFQRALARLAPALAATDLASPQAQPATAYTVATLSAQDPRGFLLEVMRNHSVPLSLRIDAAKALLPQADDRGP